MEVWNGIWKKILVWNGIWNGRFLVWNGNETEENCQYGIWKNRLPFHSIPCPAVNIKKTFKQINQLMKKIASLLTDKRLTNLCPPMHIL